MGCTDPRPKRDPGPIPTPAAPPPRRDEHLARLVRVLESRDPDAIEDYIKAEVRRKLAEKDVERSRRNLDEIRNSFDDHPSEWCGSDGYA